MGEPRTRIPRARLDWKRRFVSRTGRTAISKVAPMLGATSEYNEDRTESSEC